MLFATYDDVVTGGDDALNNSSGSNAAQTAPSSTQAEQVFKSVKQLEVDDLLDGEDGKIKRPRTKWCKHGPQGMCEYCMPLEPWNKEYQEQHNIKHLSFHAYLKQLNSESNKKGSGSSYMAPLTEPDYTVKKNCPSGHPPWPDGICSKCQPSAITLQQQSYRMVDHVEFSSSVVVNSFIESWRQTGTQRIGYLYGKYQPYEAVPLGIKAVVEAIVEPPQHNEFDGVTLSLPWEEEQAVDEMAKRCNIQKVGIIYTDLVDSGQGDGSVVCKRHVDSYFLSSLELGFAAQLQKKNPNPCRWSSSGQFSSKFVTCVISGNIKGEIDISSYQSSISAEAMLTADLIQPTVNPSLMRVKEPSRLRYVPDVFYRKMNEYNRAVQENAKPAFPVEYLLVTLTHGFPETSSPLFTSEAGAFPIENRPHIGTVQDLRALATHLGLSGSQNNENKTLDAISDFHLLLFIHSLGILSSEEEQLLSKVATEHKLEDGLQLLETGGWQTLLTIIRESV